MRDKLLAGAPCDAIILTAPLIAALEAAGHVRARQPPRRSAACAPASPCARASRCPPIADGPALRADARRRGGLYFPDPELATAGIHFMKVLRELGIHDAVAPRLHPFPNGAAAMRELARSTATGLVGCTQITEIEYTPGVVLVGPLPAGFELSTVYSVAVCTQRARSPSLRRRFVEMLSGPATRALREAAGFE